MESCPIIEVSISIYRAEEGGRKRPIIVKVYRPHFRVIGKEEYLGVEFINDSYDNIEPGSSYKITVRLMYYPNVSYADLSAGKDFEILEGPNVVGRGYVI